MHPKTQLGLLWARSFAIIRFFAALRQTMKAPLPRVFRNA